MNQQNWPDHTVICIPAYKAEGTLETFLPLLLKKVPSEKIIVVDDASYDKTDTICKTHSVTCLKHDINKGKGAALNTGFQYIFQNKEINWIITMDADGQHDIHDLDSFTLYVKNSQNIAICIGKRDMRIGKMPFFRMCSNKITSAILSIYCKSKIFDSQCGYRIYSTDFLKKISIECNRFEMESEVILKAAFLGYNIGFIPVRTLYLGGNSHISHLYDTIRWVRAVLRINLILKKSN